MKPSCHLSKLQAKGIDTPKVVLAYWYKSLNNLIRDHLKKSSKVSYLEDMGNNLLMDKHFTQKDHSRQIELEDLKDKIILMLSPIEAQLFSLKWEGNSNKEISETTGINLSTVGVKLMRIKQKIRDNFYD